LKVCTRVTCIEITYVGLNLKTDGLKVLNNFKILSFLKDCDLQIKYNIILQHEQYAV